VKIVEEKGLSLTVA
jgi:hypothetical protein